IPMHSRLLYISPPSQFKLAYGRGTTVRHEARSASEAQRVAWGSVVRPAWILHLIGRPPYRQRSSRKAKRDQCKTCHPPGRAGRPPNQSSPVPTATGPRKPVEKPANAQSASDAPRWAGSADATAPPASAPTSAPAVADKARHVATEAKHIPMT